MIKFVGQCHDNHCRCEDDDCIEKAINYIESDIKYYVNSVEDEKSINEIIQEHLGWEKIRVHIDSGAIDTVGPKSVGRAFAIKETKALKSGTNHVAANGSVIKNHDERIIKAETENGLRVSMPMQVADVKRVLMSTHKMNDTGLNVVFDGENSFFVEKSSGKPTPTKYENGRYFFDIWTPAFIKKHDIKQKGNDDMDCSQFGKINSINRKNRFWVLGADDQEEGF